MLARDARRNHHRAMVPEELVASHYVGEAWGIYHESSGILNILPTQAEASFYEGAGRGIFVEHDSARIDMGDCLFRVEWVGEDLVVHVGDDVLDTKPYDLVQSVFSRNSGIVESASMRKKAVVILGCGSVGSKVALDLARSGVGRFLLLDNDVLEYHNVCRHQCGIGEVGAYKVDALRRRVLDINPAARVETLATLAEYAPKELFDRWLGDYGALVVGCADNREADAYANSVCVMYAAPFISIGFWERAFAGEVFYWLPDRGMPCYRCAVGDGSLSNRASASRRLYTTQENMADVRFEPGIAVDIDFVTCVGIKLALDVLNVGSDEYTARLLPTLQQYTLVCNTNNPTIGGEMAEIFSYPLQVTTSLKVSFGMGCPPCRYGGEEQ